MTNPNSTDQPNSDGEKNEEAPDAAALVCDRCGEGLLVDEDVRYEVEIEVKAAYDTLEITEEDLEKDLKAEMNAILDQLRSTGKEEAQDRVYRKMDFDLCASCQKAYLKNPLGAPRDTP